MSEVLKSYLRRLTNLSGNNRSLLLMKLITDQFIDLHDFDYSSGEPSFEIIKQLISHQRQIVLSDEIDPRDAKSNTASQRLKRIHRREKFIFEERGSRDLYVGWPFVKGKFSDGTLVRCPMVFFPVEIEVRENQWKMSLRQDVNITLNKTFLLAYAFYNGLSPDDELVEHLLTDYNRDATVFRTQLYELIKDSNLSLHFNQENFMDKLQAFREYKKSDLEAEEKTGELKLFPEAVLGIYPQAGSYLVPDYLQLLEKEVKDIGDLFISTSKDETEPERYSDRVLEENTYTPFQLDASQEKALKYVKRGNSLTVQGPPGSGKSQLIANMISDFIARGKNVLLVCQKRAALDVVYERLRQRQLSDFLALVHDFKNDRKDIFEKISGQIERVDEYRQKNNQLDTIQLERSFIHASRKIDEISEELEDYRRALFDEEDCGKSAKELYLTTDLNQPFVHLRQHYNDFKYPTLADFETRLRRYLGYQGEFEHKNHYWAHELSFAKLETRDFVLIKEVLDDCVTTFDRFVSQSDELLHKKLDYDATYAFVQKRDELNQFISTLDNEDTYGIFKLMLDHTPDESGDWVVQMQNSIMGTMLGSGLETSLKSSDLGRFQEALEHAIHARRNPFSWIRWKIFSKDRIFVTRVFVANGLKSNRRGFDTLIEKIDNRLNYEHNVSIINGKKWLPQFPEMIRKVDIENWFFFVRNAYKSFSLFTVLRNIDAYISFKSDQRKAQIQALTEFGELLDIFPIHKEKWQRYLTDNQIRELLSGRISLKEAKRQLDRDFENLCDFHQLREGFSNTERRIAELIQEVEGGSEAQMHCFYNSLGLSWLDHLESKYPVLRTVSSQKFEQQIKELRAATEEKRSTSTEILRLKSRERTYENLEFNRLNNLVTYRELSHQVTKKKRIWPLRKVISEYREELFRLIPCWMTSPESASAIFPMETVFDLVIFDEASQCFAERGIPSMYRGKQVVVTGDHQQLKPFDLYRARWEDENEEETPELEIDSLLDLSVRYFPQFSLNGHYRSQSLGLIDFSNQHFYKGRLKMIPHRDRINDTRPPISYVKVDGIWKNNQNEVEAQKVRELVVSLAKDHPKKSVGVVTFNSSQQTLILDMVDDAVQDGQPIPPSFFVKNIENVQGDERDLIIFSTGYAKDEKGKLQLRFGSLNLEGGENRLNVAVTRAREEILIVTSILPGEIKAKHTKNAGPKLLAAYLQYAFDIDQAKWLPTMPTPEKSSFDWYLKKRVEKENSNLSPTQNMEEILPFADLTVTGDEYQGLVLTDDDLYFNAVSAKDIYVYQYEQLLEKKWSNIQVYSREHWVNPTTIEDRLRIFLNSVRN